MSRKRKQFKLLTVDEMIEIRRKAFEQDDIDVQKEIKAQGNITNEEGAVIGYDHHVPGLNDHEYEDEAQRDARNTFETGIRNDLEGLL